MNEMNKQRGARSATLSLCITPERAAAFREAAKSANTSLSAWLTMAANSYLGNWKDPMAKRRQTKDAETKTWPSGWAKEDPCFDCTQAHDPLGSHEWVTQEHVDRYIGYLSDPTVSWTGKGKKLRP